MRYSVLASLATALCFLLPGAGEAQSRIPPRIDAVQVGFGSSAPVAKFKPGFWTPVYIDFIAGSEGNPRGELVVESVDSDDVPNRYTVALPQLERGEQERILAFTKPGNIHEITVRAFIDERPIATKESQCAAMMLDQQLLLVVGSGLPGLRAAVSKGGDEENVVGSDEQPRQLVQVDDVRMLPSRWFGYESADLLILSTGNRDFLTALAGEKSRMDALAEWVRRGGRIVIAVGRNQDMVSQIEALQTLLPISVEGILQRPRLRSIAKWSGPQHPVLESPPPAKVIDIADLKPKPGRETERVLTEQDGPPLIVRGAYGLGRVTVVAVDLDPGSPFGRWTASARKDFWTKLLQETAPPLPPQVANQPRGFNPYLNQQNYDRASQLQMNLEDFEDVPVISFGWVALFILLYILVVGPLDYFFLKKVVKRLELTWVTFPTVVITISVAAYFTAYWLKGNDQKINKVDLVDIDLHTQQVVGNTWFTIFSPRIQHYTIGLEPAAAEWAGPAAGAKASDSVVLSWMARPEISYGGTGRSQTPGLFRRAYDYLPDARGLKGVPIQVWSTKSFAASWQAALDRAKPPIRADLRRASEKAPLSGKITSQLPVELEDVVLYASSSGEGKWYSLGSLVPGGEVSVANIHAAGRETLTMDQWIKEVPAQSYRRVNPQGNRYGPVPSEQTVTVIKGLLFHQFDQSGRRDNALRSLDQSWRTRHKDEVILFGRVPRTEQPAEDATAAGTSPTRLWLGTVPDSGEARLPLQGTLGQETYVRMIIPVRTAE